MASAIPKFGHKHSILCFPYNAKHSGNDQEWSVKLPVLGWLGQNTS